MTPMTLRVLGVATLAFAPLAAAQLATYASREIRLAVVDDETEAPMAGVAIAAQWNLVRYGAGFARRDEDILFAQEAVSDAQGRATLPAWGPVARPLLSRLDDGEPQILAFAEGYYPRIVRGPRWDGGTIRMRRFTGAAQRYEEFDGRFRTPVEVDGSLEGYAMRIGDLQGRLGWRKDDDRWTRHPRMVAAILRERARLAPLMGQKVAVISSRATLWGDEAQVGKILEGDGK